MATANIIPTPAPIEAFPTTGALPNVTAPSSPTVRLLGPNSTVASADMGVKAPFTSIRALFDYLYTHKHDAAALNATSPSPRYPEDQRHAQHLRPEHPYSGRWRIGLNEVFEFFNTVSKNYVPNVLDSLSVLADTDLRKAHKNWTMNFRLCDYNSDTAAPQSDNGCGSHTDYGTFTIIFQDGSSGLEFEDADAPGTWTPIPGDATAILTGWCAVVLSGGRISAARHRVRRVAGVRRLSAVLFVAPDLDVAMQPLEGVLPVRRFSDMIMRGDMDVDTFKQVMGKRWRYRERNEEMVDGEDVTQDGEIEALIWA